MIRAKAAEYNVGYNLMVSIVACESNFSSTIQSRHRYTKDNVPRGYSVGDREQSWGLIQLHLPAHPNITKGQALDPYFAIDFLARNIKAGKANMWSCYRKLAMR